MKVCDKCRKSIKGSNTLKIKTTTYELCDVCVSKIETWLIRPQGIAANLSDIFGGTN